MLASSYVRRCIQQNVTEISKRREEYDSSDDVVEEIEIKERQILNAIVFFRAVACSNVQGLISSKCLREAFTLEDPKSAKGCLTYLSFWRFWDLRAEKLLVKCRRN